MGTVPTNDQNFQTDVLESNIPVLVDFWAEWCGPCRMVAPIIEQLAEEYDGKALIGKVNVDHNPEVSMKYGVRSIPTILIFKDGEIVEKHVGTATKATLEQKLTAHL